MRTLVCDIEGDNLLDKITKVHCIVAHELETGTVRRFNSQKKRLPGVGTIEEGLAYIETADGLVFHNGLSFDIPALKKLYPKFNPKGKLLDTLVCVRVMWPDRFELLRRDAKLGLPPALRGLHSLKAWGYRLREYKGTFGKPVDDEEAETVWAVWTQEMEDYCVQDVKVTLKLCELIQKKNWSAESFELEHRFREIMDLQERHGFRLDVPAVQKLYAELSKQRLVLETKLQKVFPPRIETMKTPAYYEGTKGVGPTFQFTTKGEAKKAGYKDSEITPGPLKTKEHPFNPASGEQILERLVERYNWKPTVYGLKKKVVECNSDEDRAAAIAEGFSPKITDEVLRGLTYPEAPTLADYLVISKRIGQVAEGKEAWLKLERGGRIHGRVNTAGAVTGRCTHSKPNVAQVPAVQKTKAGILMGLEGGFGWECRAVWLPDIDHVLVGADASGLELRCLAHFMGKYDGGAYGRVLLEGDVHSFNQEAAQLWMRDSAKTLIYAYLYGGGDAKVGTIVVADAMLAKKPIPKGSHAELGKRAKSRLLQGIPALARLKDAIKAAVDSRGYLVGLDGRILPVRSAHAALNTLLQSAGALVMKKALVLLYDALIARGYSFGTDFAFVANIHDEIQTSCRPEIAEEVGKLAVVSIRQAGEHFGFRCPLDGEFKVGQSWAHTH